MTASPAGERREVVLDYLGHSAFLWTTLSGARILIDPFGNPGDPRPAPSFGSSPARWFVRPFPPVECDVVLVTHPHFDHDAVGRLPGAPTIVRDALGVEGGDFSIQGFQGLHARHFGAEFGQRNVIFTLDVAGVTFCHLGDNRAELPKDFLESAGSIDILMISVDGNEHLLTPEEVDRVVETLNPLVVTPTHYRVDGLTDPGAPLGGIQDWLYGQPNVRFIDTGRVNISPSDLPAGREVWTFDLPSINIP